MTVARLIASALSGLAGGFFGLAIWQTLVLLLIWYIAIEVGEWIEIRKQQDAISRIVEESKRRFP